jgi:hypothetical protein
MADGWFSPGSLVSSSNKTDLHDITEILLKVVLNTITQTLKSLQLKKDSIFRTRKGYILVFDISFLMK